MARWILSGVNALVEELVSGSLVIDCSTISPSNALEFSDRLKSLVVLMVDALAGGMTRS